MNKNTKIYIAGHRGMVGSAIYNKFKLEGFNNLLTATHKELDLTRQNEVEKFFNKHKPEIVIIAAAKVGGILANNTYRAEFIYNNLMIESNIIHASYLNNVKKLIFLGSSCIYPKLAPQPLKEEYLLSGYLEYTNEPYAIAKIAGIKLCENYYKQYGCNYFSVMPTNLYGSNDNFDLEKSHVLPALIRKFHLGKCLENNDWDGIIKDLSKNPIEGIDGSASKEEILNILEKYGIKIVSSKQHVASSENRRNTTHYPLPTTDHSLHTTHNTLQPKVAIEVWGTGKPKREFLYVDDLADAVYFLMNSIDANDLYDKEISHINIGTGEDLTIAELVNIIAKVIEFKGKIKYDSTKPDGTPRKLLDVSRLHNLGWKHKTTLEQGIKKAYEWYKNN